MEEWVRENENTLKTTGPITIRKMVEWVRENENTLKTIGKKKKKKKFTYVFSGSTYCNFLSVISSCIVLDGIRFLFHFTCNSL